MINYFVNANPVMQAFIATLFTYSFTVMGSALVFLFKRVDKNVMDSLLAGASGLMIAASFFSLLSPSIEYAGMFDLTPWLCASIGFLIGGLFLFVTDRVSEHYLSKVEGKDKKKRMLMLMISITMHNIPEGMVVGFAFASVQNGVSITSACLLTLGIAIQNFPEGSALSIPMRRDGMSRGKAFFWGQLSGVVEVAAGIIGATLVLAMKSSLPFMLSFAAGAMIYVVTMELIPESQTNKRKDLMALFTILGFILMMALDVGLG